MIFQKKIVVKSPIQTTQIWQSTRTACLEAWSQKTLPTSKSCSVLRPTTRAVKNRYGVSFVAWRLTPQSTARFLSLKTSLNSSTQATRCWSCNTTFRSPDICSKRKLGRTWSLLQNFMWKQGRWLLAEKPTTRSTHHSLNCLKSTSILSPLI